MFRRLFLFLVAGCFSFCEVRSASLTLYSQPFEGVCFGVYFPTTNNAIIFGNKGNIIGDAMFCITNTTPHKIVFYAPKKTTDRYRIKNLDLGLNVLPPGKNEPQNQTGKTNLLHHWSRLGLAPVSIDGHSEVIYAHPSASLAEMIKKHLNLKRGGETRVSLEQYIFISDSEKGIIKDALSPPVLFDVKIEKTP